MKQILQNIKDGKTYLEELPAPSLDEHAILIKTRRSLVSLGTERMLVEFGKANLIQKARQQPDKIKQVLDKIRADGLLPTMEAVFSKLGQPIPLGYCNVGNIIAIGEKVTKFSVGDRVASNGPHAEIVSVPHNLVVKIPDTVSDNEATFTVIGSIGLQGVRLLNPTIGEIIVVYGLGLIGLITCQILKANGCKVIGVDVNQSKCDLASSWGLKTVNPNNSNLKSFILDSTNQVGVDGVIITASTKNDNIISQSAKICRRRGRIVLVGVIDLKLDRLDFYEKELSFQVSCSYGPGRYDNKYENDGFDYPIAYVRWTENRNFETILDLIKNKSLNLKNLITQQEKLDNFKSVYNSLSDSRNIAAILKYKDIPDKKTDTQTITIKNTSIRKSERNIGIIGSGNFANRTLLPTLNKLGANVKYISSLNGLNGTHLAKKYNIEKATTNYNKILTDKNIDTIIIATPHNSHAKIAIESIKAGKDTFVEKPLALKYQDLKKIIYLSNQHPQTEILVGFNRRFSPHLVKIKDTLGTNVDDLNIVATMNAGKIPVDHWTQDLNKGGGRIVGEACHLIDICIFLTSSLVKAVCMTTNKGTIDLSSDNASILLKFHNGSNAVINYFSNGSKQYGKERVEVYSQERTWIMDNYIKTVAFDVKGFKTLKTKQDKGHYKQFENFINRKNTTPISKDEIFNVSKASLATLESMKENRWVDII